MASFIQSGIIQSLLNIIIFNMKKILILFTLFMLSLGAFSQSGGSRTHVTTLVNSGSSIQLMYKNAYGKIIPFPNGTEGQYLKITDGIPTWENYVVRNPSYQTFSSTSISFDPSGGSNANITITGNTTITFSNLTAGDFGAFHVTNPTTLYTLTFSGYSFVIGQAIRKTNYQVFLSALDKYDLFTWDYNGVFVTITGQLDLKLN